MEALVAQFFSFDIGKHVEEFGHVESYHIDAAYEAEAEAYVVRPMEDLKQPAPVIMVLSGQGNVDDRQGMMGPSSPMDLLLRNQFVRTKFWTVFPKPSTQNGLVRYTGQGYRKEWAEDAVWALFTEILRKLGPEKVDPSKLGVTGISMGAAGVWNLAVRYGDMLSAVCPISGQCDWHGDSWPKGQDPNPTVVARLSQLPLRAYQIDVDNYAGSPVRDLQWLTSDIPVKTVDKKLDSTVPGNKVDVTVHTWARPKGEGATWELYLAKGPLTDIGEPLFNGSDDHCLWFRVWPVASWGLGTFLQRHVCPEERRWRFDMEPLRVDSSDARQRLRALWGDDFDVLRPEDGKVAKVEFGEKDEGAVDRILSKEEDIPEILSRMERCLRDAVKKAQGRPVAVSLRTNPVGPMPTKTDETQPQEKKKEERDFMFCDKEGNQHPLRCEVGTAIFVVKMIMVGGDFLKAMSFGIGLSPTNGHESKALPDDYQLRIEDALPATMQICSPRK